MKIIKIGMYLFISIFLISCITAEGEIITGDTIYIDNEEFYLSATPHTLYESGNVTFVVESKFYNGNLDMIFGFNKLTAKVKSIKYKDEKVKDVKKPLNKIVNKKHLLYTDKENHINRNNKIEFVVWIDVDDLSKGKYDFMVKPSYLTIDEAKELNQLYILDPWWDNTFRYRSLVSIDNRGNPYTAMHQVNVNISYNDYMQSDFDDIRFIFADSIPISYWIESYNESDYCNVWLKVPYLLSDAWNNISVTMYYGNSGVTNLSNMSNTFIQGHENTSTNFKMNNIVSNPFIFEAKIFQDNSAAGNAFGVKNNDPNLDLSGFSIDNTKLMYTRLSNDGVSTSHTVNGAYQSKAIYKMCSNSTIVNFYVNDTLHHGINTNIPDELMGLYYSKNHGYCEWMYIRKYAIYDPIVIIEFDRSLYLKYDSVTPVTNIVASDGVVSATSGNDTQWMAEAQDHDAHIVINEYNNGTGEFQIILTYPIKSFTVTGFDPNTFITLSRENVFTKTGIADNKGEYKFEEILGDGIYSVFARNYDNITGVHGFIYEGTSGSTIPLSETVIYIYNNTWSNTTTSDSSGYYTFTNLTNSTYTLNFKKDRYEEVLYQYVTPVNRSMYYKNIYMQKSTGDYYSRHYCTFILKNIYGTKFKNINTVVYLDDIVKTSGKTGYDGSVVFHLFEDEEYYITFINTTQNINEEITISPRDDKYIIWVGRYSLSPENDTRTGNVDYWWTENEINISQTWLNFSYKNLDNKTTFINYWINDTDGLIVYHTSQAYPCASGIYEVNYIVNSSNNTFVVHFSAHHIDYPGLENSVVQTFSYYHAKLINLFFDEQWQYTVVSLFLIIILGTLFGATNAAQGSLIMVLCTWFFSFIGWLPTSVIGYGAIVLATLLSVGWNLRKNDIVHA